MGSCISKCKPKKKSKDDYCSKNVNSSHVHDKLVISQDYPIPPLLPHHEMPTMLPASPKKPLSRSPAPSSLSSTASSFSSFSCSTKTKCTTALSTSSSSSSSYSSSHVLSAKERSFSNEFLLSCAKDNPHVIGQYPRIRDRNPDKPATCANKIHNPRRPESPSIVSSPKVVKSFIREKHINTGSTPKKRARASSPTIVRQKSFRRDHQQIVNPACPVPNRGLMRSPSPSRRFNGEQNNRSSVSFMNGTNESSYKRHPVAYRSGAINPAGSTSGVRSESFRAPAASPGRDMLVMDHRNNVSARKMDTFSQQVVSPNFDGGINSSPDVDAVMEDVNNPNIALDCFIFL